MADFVESFIFLIPVFLAVAGIQTDFRVLTFALILIPRFFVMIVAGRWHQAARRWACEVARRERDRDPDELPRAA